MTSWGPLVAAAAAVEGQPAAALALSQTLQSLQSAQVRTTL